MLYETLMNFCDTIKGFIPQSKYFFIIVEKCDNQ